MIYFIQGEITKHIKIGYARHAEHRLRDLQAASPDLLRIIGVCIGGKEEEGILHSVFKGYRLHNEWFQSSGSLIDYINKNTVIDVDSIFTVEMFIGTKISESDIERMTLRERINLGGKLYKEFIEKVC